jgi:hypothetical protein
MTKAGGPTHGHRPLPEVGQHEHTAFGKGVIGSDRCHAGFGSDERVVESVVVERSTQDATSVSPPSKPTEAVSDWTKVSPGCATCHRRWLVVLSRPNTGRTPTRDPTRSSVELWSVTRSIKTSARMWWACSATGRPTSVGTTSTIVRCSSRVPKGSRSGAVGNQTGAAMGMLLLGQDLGLQECLGS